MKFHLNLAFRGVIGILNIFVISTPNIVFSGTKDFSENEPVVIAVRKFKNFAGDFAENGVIEGSNGEKVRVGFWKPSYEIKLAEVLTTELANTGHFNIVERNNLYEVYNEQSISGIQNNIKKANYIIIASLSDYIPNTAGSRSNSDGREIGRAHV